MAISFFTVRDLGSSSPLDVEGLELVEAGEHTGTSNTTEHVGTSSLHHAHETLLGHDLACTVDGTVVLDSATGGHHHPPPDGV